MARNEPKWDARIDGSVFVSHWVMSPDDIARLSSAQRLTLWNVRFPSSFTFADLPSLDWLDIRGGSRADVAYLDGVKSLRGLSINQVRGLADLSSVSDLTNLRILTLYGLAKVTSLPDLSALTQLRRFEIGQLRNLADWAGLTSAPALEELAFLNTLNPDLTVISKLAAHPTMREFEWWAPDVPARTQQEVRDRLALPKTRAVRPEQWLAQQSSR